MKTVVKMGVRHACCFYFFVTLEQFIGRASPVGENSTMVSVVRFHVLDQYSSAFLRASGSNVTAFYRHLGRCKKAYWHSGVPLQFKANSNKTGDSVILCLSLHRRFPYRYNNCCSLWQFNKMTDRASSLMSS